MIWTARALRALLVGVCLMVLSGIVPISLTHFQTGNACPALGPVPACYIVSGAYAAMALAGLIWWRVALRLFLLGAVPVILLAASGTIAEVAGVPTCPRAANGMPLCYLSLAIGLGVLAVFMTIKAVEGHSPAT